MLCKISQEKHRNIYLIVLATFKMMVTQFYDALHIDFIWHQVDEPKNAVLIANTLEISHQTLIIATLVNWLTYSSLIVCIKGERLLT